MKIEPLYDRSVPDKCPSVYRPYKSEDGAIVRVRSGGQFLPTTTLMKFAEIASQYGDGYCYTTSRGALQIRGINPNHLDDVTIAVEALGLIPSKTHELCRNIVVSPLTGLAADDGGANLHGPKADLTGWAATLDQAICASPALAELPGRFLFVLDDGRGDVARLRCDIAYQAISKTEGIIAIGQGVQTWKVPASEAIPAIISLAEQFAEKRRNMTQKAWHIAELDQPLTLRQPDGTSYPEGESLYRGGHDTRYGLVGRFGDTGTDVLPTELPEATDADPGAIVVGCPFGMINLEQIRTLAEVTETVLITAFRSIVIPDATIDLAKLASVGFIIDPSSAWAFVGACTGTDGCARATVDTREIARQLVTAFDAHALEYDGHPIYVSSCNRRCGAPNEKYHDIFNPTDINDAIRQLSDPGALPA